MSSVEAPTSCRSRPRQSCSSSGPMGERHLSAVHSASCRPSLKLPSSRRSLTWCLTRQLSPPGSWWVPVPNRDIDQSPESRYDAAFWLWNVKYPRWDWCSRDTLESVSYGVIRKGRIITFTWLMQKRLYTLKAMQSQQTWISQV